MLRYDTPAARSTPPWTDPARGSSRSADASLVGGSIAVTRPPPSRPPVPARPAGPLRLGHGEAAKTSDTRHYRSGPGQCAGRVTEGRSEEHTSELQSRRDLVCRL